MITTILLDASGKRPCFRTLVRNIFVRAEFAARFCSDENRFTLGAGSNVLGHGGYRRGARARFCVAPLPNDVLLAPVVPLPLAPPVRK